MLSKEVITGALRSYKYSKCVLKVENPEYIFTERQFAVSHTLNVLIIHLYKKKHYKISTRCMLSVCTDYTILLL